MAALPSPIENQLPPLCGPNVQCRSCRRAHSLPTLVLVFPGASATSLSSNCWSSRMIHLLRTYRPECDSIENRPRMGVARLATLAFGAIPSIAFGADKPALSPDAATPLVTTSRISATVEFGLPTNHQQQQGLRVLGNSRGLRSSPGPCCPRNLRRLSRAAVRREHRRPC